MTWKVLLRVIMPLMLVSLGLLLYCIHDQFRNNNNNNNNNINNNNNGVLTAYHLNLEEYPNAKCLNGEGGIYYFRPGMYYIYIYIYIYIVYMYKFRHSVLLLQLSYRSYSLLRIGQLEQCDSFPVNFFCNSSIGSLIKLFVALIIIPKNQNKIKGISI